MLLPTESSEASGQWSSMQEFTGLSWPNIFHFSKIHVTFSETKANLCIKINLQERMLGNSLPNFGILRKKDRLLIGRLVAAMAAANEVARVMAEAAALVQETWKDMAGGLGAPKRRNSRSLCLVGPFSCHVSFGMVEGVDFMNDLSFFGRIQWFSWCSDTCGTRNPMQWNHKLHRICGCGYDRNMTWYIKYHVQYYFSIIVTFSTNRSTSWFEQAGALSTIHIAVLFGTSPGFQKNEHHQSWIAFKFDVYICFHRFATQWTVFF